MWNVNARRLSALRRGIALIRNCSFIAILLTLCGTLTAHASSVLLNGGFEGGTLTPWATTGSATAFAGANINPPDGSGIAVVGISQVGSFFQNFNLADAGMFDYAFLVGRSEGFCGCNDVPLTFTARIDDIILSTALPAFSASGSGGHFSIELLSSYTGSLFLSAGPHVLSFDLSRQETLFGRAPYFAFDGVSLNLLETGPVSEVPVPAALPLFATGLGVLGLLAHRRRRKAA
jgi:hypothetical protein